MCVRVGGGRGDRQRSSSTWGWWVNRVERAGLGRSRQQARGVGRGGGERGAVM